MKDNVVWARLIKMKAKRGRHSSQWIPMSSSKSFRTVPNLPRFTLNNGRRVPSKHSLLLVGGACRVTWFNSMLNDSSAALCEAAFISMSRCVCGQCTGSFTSTRYLHFIFSSSFPRYKARDANVSRSGWMDWIFCLCGDHMYLLVVSLPSLCRGQ